MSIAVTSGVVYQLHRQVFPLLDMASGDNINVVNHPTTPNVAITNLNVLTDDADGAMVADAVKFVYKGSS